MNQALQILHRDPWLVAISKPSGLMVHRSRIADDRRFALQMLRDQIGRRVYPVHRLDRGTSGVLLFALDGAMAGQVNQALRSQGADKRYLAVVRGFVECAGVIDYPLRERRDKERRPAVSHYRRIATVELPVAVGPYPCARYSLVEVRPETGRMHQIRKHFAHISHPLVGDTTHGEGRHNRLFRVHFGIHRLLLHAASLRIRHPATRLDLTVHAPLPEELRRLFRMLGCTDQVDDIEPRRPASGGLRPQ